MERRLAVHAGSHRQALISLAALLAFAAPARAAPRSRAAKAQFAKGVAAYRKDDYAGASAAFGKSYAVEVDVETLFAWAQAERKQGDCEKAIVLYGKLLVSKLPAANKTVVRDQLEECERIIADDQTAARAAAGKATAERAEADRGRQAEADRAAKADADRDARAKADRAAALQFANPPVVTTSSPWYDDGLGDTLAILGIASVGVGIAMLMSGHAADADSRSPSLTYQQFLALDDKAKSRGTLGVIAGGAGAGLLVLGVIRYATRSTGDEKTNVTAWLGGGGGVLAVAGRF